MNFSAEYWDRVFANFLQEYQAGRTPNPDILCNREIKFRAFLDHVRDSGATKIATGHYARIAEAEDGRLQLWRGVDTNKDQSYFLYTLNQQQLAHSLFPLGEFTKPQVRAMASEWQLTNHAKKDSTGICFIGERRFRDFLQQYVTGQKGSIETADGVIIGRHEGLMFYTIGQRQGLGIGGLANYSDEPWYVAQKDLQRNVLVVVQGHDHPLLLKPQLEAEQIHWISGEEPDYPLRCSAKIRYRQSDQVCTVEKRNDQSIVVRFEQPQRAVTAGQSVVFYQGENCLGGGIITTQ